LDYGKIAHGIAQLALVGALIAFLSKPDRLERMRQKQRERLEESEARAALRRDAAGAEWQAGKGRYLLKLGAAALGVSAVLFGLILLLALAQTSHGASL